MTVQEAINQLQEFADQGWDHLELLTENQGDLYPVDFCLSLTETEVEFDGNYYIEVL